jgi:hypothetical protein
MEYMVHGNGQTPKRGETEMSPRFIIAERFLESAKDMGDAAMIAVARRVVEATYRPITKMCSAADLVIFREWQAQ